MNIILIIKKKGESIMTLKETKMPIKEGTYTVIVCTAVGAFLVVLLL